MCAARLPFRPPQRQGESDEGDGDGADHDGSLGCHELSLPSKGEQDDRTGSREL